MVNYGVYAEVPGLSKLSEKDRDLLAKALEYIVKTSMTAVHKKGLCPPFEVFPVVLNREIEDNKINEPVLKVVISAESEATLISGSTKH